MILWAKKITSVPGVLGLYSRELPPYANLKGITIEGVRPHVVELNRIDLEQILGENDDRLRQWLRTLMSALQ